MTIEEMEDLVANGTYKLDFAGIRVLPGKVVVSFDVREGHPEESDPVGWLLDFEGWMKYPERMLFFQDILWALCRGCRTAWKTGRPRLC